MKPNAHGTTLTVTDGTREMILTGALITWTPAGDDRVRTEHRDLVVSPATFTHTYELVGSPIVWAGTIRWSTGPILQDYAHLLDRRAEARERALRAAHRRTHPGPRRARVMRRRSKPAMQWEKP